MPFSFKPEISTTDASGVAPAASQPTSFGNPPPSAPTPMMAREGGQQVSIVHSIILFAFWGAILIALGLFAYNYYLNDQIDRKKATLASYESRLATLPLEDMRRLSNRIKIINQLVQEHPSANVAFRIIEDSVENQITYKGFELRFNDSTKTYNLQLRAIAPDYRSIAQQIDTFKRKPYTTYIPTVSVESLQPDTLGKVGFTLKMPIMIMGLLPEGLNLSAGASERVGVSSTSPSIMAATTTPLNMATSSQVNKAAAIPMNTKATTTVPVLKVLGPQIPTKASSTTPLR